MGATNKQVRTEIQCVAVNEAVALFHDKWTLFVLGALSHAPSLRYGELRGVVGGISQRMLTLTLKSLTASGLVERTGHATVPPRVDYALTPLGRTLIRPLRELLDWSLGHHDEMVAARERSRTGSHRKPSA